MPSGIVEGVSVPLIAAALVGLGYDFRIGTNVSLTPFVNGYAMKNDNTDANVGQIGLGLTVH